MSFSSNFTRYAQKGDYMPLKDRHCLNMVTAVIDYYRRMPPPYRLKTIYLDHKHWQLFTEDVKQQDDSYPINATEGVLIEGCDVTIKRGSMFQQREMKYEFW